MHLKTLTLRGFKSFASSTTLRFEPGITAVVGPNGSGKSNVVDAIAWVLGEQGAKTLRGGKMQDVIFAGTAGRAPLGRAEVTLTIDNADGSLPIDYTEVSITRRMFRDGASDYEINGDSARLLDIQELLSDSGIGREMHVIVGQGQLDNVLQARPEDRRGFIEEAAGVLKHRRRKEKALRKLDGLQVNLTRLSDLTNELRRQLKPLGRQAELARRAAGVQAELRDCRLRLLADDLATLREQFNQEVAGDAASLASQAAAQQRLAVLAQTESALEAQLSDTSPAAAEANTIYLALSGLRERFRSTEKLAEVRIRHLSQSLQAPRSGRDPEELEADSARVSAEDGALQAQLVSVQQSLAVAIEDRQSAEAALSRAEKHFVDSTRAAADRREGLAKLTGRVNAFRARAAAGVDEIARFSAAAAQARQRAADAEAGVLAAEEQASGLEADAVGLEETYEAAQRREGELSAELAELAELARSHDRDISTWTTRRDTLARGLARQDGAGAVLAATELTGVLGAVSALVTVQPGYELAVAAALGAAVEAVVVDSTTSAQSVLELLKATKAGQAGMLIAPATPVPAAATDQARPPLTGGGRWVADVLTAPPAVAAALAVVLADVAIVESLHAARELLARGHRLRAVTIDGDMLGDGWASGGSPSAPSVLELQAEVDEAQRQLTVAVTAAETIALEVVRAGAEHGQAQADVAQQLAVLNSSDARFNAVAEQLAQLGQSARLALAEAERLDGAARAAEQAHQQDLAGLAELEEQLTNTEIEPLQDEPSTIERDELAQLLEHARQREIDARLSVRTLQERARAVAGRAEQLLRAAATERAERAARQVKELRRANSLEVAQAVAVVIGQAIESLDLTLARAVTEREQLHTAHQRATDELSAARNATRGLTGELAGLTAAVHRDEVARAQQLLRIEQLEARAIAEYGLEVQPLLAEYGPDQPVPVSNLEQLEFEKVRDRGEEVSLPVPGPFDRPTMAKRAAHAERELAQLGKVNPLALEEFAALQERHQFLAIQLEDLKNSRRDLMTVVKEVDDKILAVFTAAYADVAAQFEIVFASLFPGGEGRLVLTEPTDMLRTGIEIEARPPGKKVKRLSLLSGGERSLTAVALLVAIFRARPSPFYVLDEIEAALDDVNLGRLIDLIGQLRSSSQIIVITHQKRTMEVADALYGVTMRDDGISQVISQRLSPPALTPTSER